MIVNYNNSDYLVIDIIKKEKKGDVLYDRVYFLHPIDLIEVSKEIKMTELKNKSVQVIVKNTDILPFTVIDNNNYFSIRTYVNVVIDPIISEFKKGVIRIETVSNVYSYSINELTIDTINFDQDIFDILDQRGLYYPDRGILSITMDIYYLNYFNEKVLLSEYYSAIDKEAM